MNSKINKAGVKWYNIETEQANALKSDPPKSISVKINSVYQTGNSRPISFKIKYQIEGEKTKIIKISNKSGAQ